MLSGRKEKYLQASGVAIMRWYQRVLGVKFCISEKVGVVVKKKIILHTEGLAVFRRRFFQAVETVKA